MQARHSFMSPKKSTQLSLLKMIICQNHVLPSLKNFILDLQPTETTMLNQGKYKIHNRNFQFYKDFSIKIKIHNSTLEHTQRSTNPSHQSMRTNTERILTIDVPTIIFDINHKTIIISNKKINLFFILRQYNQFISSIKIKHTTFIILQYLKLVCIYHQSMKTWYLKFKHR